MIDCFFRSGCLCPHSRNKLCQSSKYFGSLKRCAIFLISTLKWRKNNCWWYVCVSSTWLALLRVGLVYIFAVGIVSKADAELHCCKPRMDYKYSHIWHKGGRLYYEFAVRRRLMQNRLVTSALTFMVRLFSGFARYCSWIYGEVNLAPGDRYWCYPWIFAISRLSDKTWPDPRSCLPVLIAILPLLLITCYAHLCHVL